MAELFHLRPLKWQSGSVSQSVKKCIPDKEARELGPQEGKGWLRRLLLLCEPKDLPTFYFNKGRVTLPRV